MIHSTILYAKYKKLMVVLSLEQVELLLNQLPIRQFPNSISLIKKIKFWCENFSINHQNLLYSPILNNNNNQNFKKEYLTQYEWKSFFFLVCILI